MLQKGADTARKADEYLRYGSVGDAAFDFEHQFSDEVADELGLEKLDQAKVGVDLTGETGAKGRAIGDVYNPITGGSLMGLLNNPEDNVAYDSKYNRGQQGQDARLTTKEIIPKNLTEREIAIRKLRGLPTTEAELDRTLGEVINETGVVFSSFVNNTLDAANWALDKTTELINAPLDAGLEALGIDARFGTFDEKGDKAIALGNNRQEIEEEFLSKRSKMLNQREQVADQQVDIESQKRIEELSLIHI